MKKERANFSLDKLNEATIRLPKKLDSLQEKTKKAQDDLEKLSREASWAGFEIVSEKKTSGNYFLDIALALANTLGKRSGGDDFHSDKVIEATNNIYSRLIDLNTKLKANPGKPILLDRTTVGGTGLSLDFGKLSSSPYINYEINEWHSFGSYEAPIKVNLNGYRRLERVDSGYRPSFLFRAANPEYHEKWYSEDITDFFALISLPHYDYNGLKKDLWGEPIEHIGGIFIGEEEIKGHLGQMKKFLDDNYKGRKINIDKF